MRKCMKCSALDFARRVAISSSSSSGTSDFAHRSRTLHSFGTLVSPFCLQLCSGRCLWWAGRGVSTGWLVSTVFGGR